MYRLDSESVRTKVQKLINWHISAKQLYEYYIEYKNPNYSNYRIFRNIWNDLVTKFEIENIEIQRFVDSLNLNRKRTYTRKETKKLFMHLLVKESLALTKNLRKGD